MYLNFEKIFGCIVEDATAAVYCCVICLCAIKTKKCTAISQHARRKHDDVLAPTTNTSFMHVQE